MIEIIGLKQKQAKYSIPEIWLKNIKEYEGRELFFKFNKIIIPNKYGWLKQAQELNANV